MDQSANLLIRVSRRAMASEFEVCFPAGKCENGTEVALEMLDQIESLEGQLSYFLPASEISRINLRAAAAPVKVEPWLFDLLRLAMQVDEETGGAYDITSAPLWEAWGFARRNGKIPSETQRTEARRCVGGHLVELDPERQTVCFRKPGVRINLGGIGKGYALDVCAERLLALGMTDFLLHGGQSSVLGRGSPAVAGQPQPWEVGLRHPGRSGRRFGMMRLHDRALGTSSGQFQSFRHQGRRYSHILDPRSGMPAEGVLSATVTAPTAALADALSTAFFVLGPKPSLEHCQNHPEIGMVMLCPSQRGSGVEIHTAGLDSDALAMT